MIRHTHSKTRLTKPVAVLFDIDNTLYDYEPANCAANQAVEGRVIDLFQISTIAYRTSLNQARQDIKNRLGSTASSHSRLLYFQRMIEILGFRPHLSIVLELEETFWNTFFINAPLFPGATEFIQLLRHQTIPLAIVTDLTTHVQLRKLIHFKLEDAFDAIVTSEEVGTDKPEMRNFELILNKLNIKANSGQVWMIGDNPKTDVVGGRTIGAVTFQKIHGTLKIGSGREAPDYTFKTFTELARGASKCWNRKAGGSNKLNDIYSLGHNKETVRSLSKVC